MRPPTDEEARQAAQAWLRNRRRKKVRQWVHIISFLVIAAAIIVEVVVRYSA